MAGTDCIIACNRERALSMCQAILLRRQRGIALVVVLWVVALLALMAVSQTAAVRNETLIVGNLVEAAQARAAAYAGLQLAIADLQKPLPARDMSTDAAFYTLHFGSSQLLISISDESGKVDINAAPGTLLDALLEASGVEPGRREALVAAILDWRDRDDLRRINGAEENDYRTAGLDYGPRNAPFQSLEELALVIGFDAQTYHAIADSLTIYSGSASINTAVAPASLLQALSALGDKAEAQPDAGDVGDSSTLSNPRSVSGGNVFSIYVEALLDSNVRERIEAVVRLVPTRANSPQRYELLRWREGVAPRLPPPEA